MDNWHNWPQRKTNGNTMSRCTLFYLPFTVEERGEMVIMPDCTSCEIWKREGTVLLCTQEDCKTCGRDVNGNFALCVCRNCERLANDNVPFGREKLNGF